MRGPECRRNVRERAKNDGSMSASADPGSPPPTTRIRGRLPSDPASRIAAASALIVILIAGAIGVTLWRYESALNRYQHDALAARSNAQTVEKAMSAFWQEQTAIFSYVAQQSKVSLANVELARTTFVSLLKTLDTKTAGEDALRVQALAANRKAYVNFVKKGSPRADRQVRESRRRARPAEATRERRHSSAERAHGIREHAGQSGGLRRRGRRERSADRRPDRRWHHPPRCARFRPLCPPADR